MPPETFVTSNSATLDIVDMHNLYMKLLQNTQGCSYAERKRVYFCTMRHSRSIRMLFSWHLQSTMHVWRATRLARKQLRYLQFHSNRLSAWWRAKCRFSSLNLRFPWRTLKTDFSHDKLQGGTGHRLQVRQNPFLGFWVSQHICQFYLFNSSQSTETVWKMSKKLHTEMRSALASILWLQDRTTTTARVSEVESWWRHRTVSQLCVGFMPPCVPSESGPCMLQSPDSPLTCPASPSGPQPPSENTQRGLKYFHHQTWAVGNHTAADGVRNCSSEPK